MPDHGSLRLVTFGVAAWIVGMAGCGPTERQRFDIEGTVIFEGKPLAAGAIRFEPNAAKGNKGPVGIAAIVNGRYSTAEPGCRGAVSGPLIAVISGFPATNPALEYQPPLFTDWRSEIDRSPASRGPVQFDFTVPKQGRP